MNLDTLIERLQAIRASRGHGEHPIVLRVGDRDCPGPSIRVLLGDVDDEIDIIDGAIELRADVECVE